jgi:hypothetical protein
MNDEASVYDASSTAPQRDGSSQRVFVADFEGRQAAFFIEKLGISRWSFTYGEPPFYGQGAPATS